MAGFVAATVREPLTYDFRPYVDDHGVIPEPSRQAQAQFNRSMLDLYGEGGADAARERLASLSPADQLAESERLTEATVDALCALCSNVPSRESILALPERLFQAYLGYIRGALLDPTS